MLYLTSDPHGGENTKGLLEYEKIATKDDLLIILGDLELNFKETELNKKFFEYFKNLKCNIAFLDGNHENFDYLETFPEEDWHGGKVHRLSENIVHLKRGEIFEIEGKTFLCFGGCKSSSRWKELGLYWPQEEPTEEELNNALKNIKRHGNKVDYVLTHRYYEEMSPTDITYSKPLDDFLKYTRKNVTYTHWYSGHAHEKMKYDSKHTVIFDELLKIEL